MEQGLTIVVPVWNRQGLIARTLDGIAAGTKLPQRLIVVDNASDDATLATCREWQRAHSSLPMDVTVLIEPRRGAACARNLGLEASRTEWVYFFDSDDAFGPTFVAEVSPRLALADANGSDILFVPVCQEIGGRMRPRAYKRPLTPAAQVLSGMLATENVVYRTTWLQALGGWNTSLSTWDDWELGVRVALASPRVEWLTHHAFHQAYVHGDSLTGPTFASRRPQIEDALRAVSAHVSGDEGASRALYLRTQIVAGMLLHEGASADGVLSVGRQLPGSSSLRLRLLGRLLRLYVSFGGRGAWRVALMATQ